MIRYLKQEEYGRTIPLWREAFPEDSEKFLEYYYGRKVKTSRMLVKEDGHGAILAMAHLNPYKVAVRGHLYELPYIVGVATAKASRRQGHMASLLVKMLQDIHGDKLPFAYLMPASPDIYTPFGFTGVFDPPVWRLGPEGQKAERVEVFLGEKGPKVEGVEVFPGEKGPKVEGVEVFSGEKGPGGRPEMNQEYLAQWMNDWLALRYEVYGVRDAQYLDVLQAELDSENGRVWGLLNSRRELEGLQAFWGAVKTEQRFLYCRRGGWIEEESLETPPHPIMARITNVEAMAEVISVRKDCPCPRMEVLIRIHDELVRENDGLWRWNLGPEGSCLIREQMHDFDVEGDDPGGDDVLKSTEVLDITVQGLTSWLFGYSDLAPAREKGEDPPFWVRYVRTLEGIFLDEIV